MQIVLIAVVAFFAALGLIIGLCKGFTRVKSWGLEYLLGGVLAVLVGVLVANVVGVGLISGIAALGSCAGFTIVCAALCAALRRGFNRRRQKRLDYEEHRSYETTQWWEKRLARAAETNKRKYKRLVRRWEKIKGKPCGLGFFNRLLGGIALAVKGAMIACLILLPALLICDLCGLAADGAYLSALGSLYTSAVWTFVKPYIFDFLVYGLICISLRCGYKNGILSVLWSVFVLALVIGAFWLGYYMAFNSSPLVSAATALDGHIGSKISGFTSLLNLETVFISKLIIAAGIAVLLIIVIMVINIFVPRLIERVRDGAAVRIIDGIFGAIIAVAVAAGLVLVFGAVLSNVYNLDFMAGFDGYFENSAIARYVYGDNLLNILGLLNNLPLSGWLS